MQMKFKILTGAVLAALLSTTAMADDVLIVGEYGNASASMKTELEAAGHTVTSVSSLPEDISAVEQIWDLRINDAISSADQTTYDTFLKNNGYLYLAGENSSFATRNNSISAFTSTLGGGAVSVGGSPSNAQGANSTYFSSDTSVDFIAAATITNTGGTGRVLASDSNGNPTGMIWIGNAGDFSSEYNGTVVVIADINWTQGNYYDANNQVFLQELIGGVVAGTVEGTIDEDGNGGDNNVGGGTPAVTETGTEAGDPIVVVTSADGGTVTTIVSNNVVSETDVEQTVETTVTTTLTTATDTTTCTTPTTVTNYSDGSSTTANGTESCATATTYASTSSATVDTVSGRIDQMSSVQDITTANIRGLEFNGAQGIASAHKYDNGLEGTTRGFSIGGKTDPNEAGFVIGGGIAQMSTSVDDADNNSASASTTALQGSIAKGAVELSVTHAMSDYSITRHIGDWTNGASTSGTDTSASIMFRPELEAENVHPVIGYTRGKRTVDAYTEGGDALTARSVAESSEMYGYGTVGATVEIGLVDITGIHHTDGVNQASISIGDETEKFNWNVGVNRTMTDLGDTNSISAGLQIKF
jgi:hypothetical protein